jgi:hypothetical protein
MHFKNVLTVVVAAFLVACGGGGGTPTTPTPAPTPSTPAASNHPPVINSMSVTPAFGIAQLTGFSFTASSSDPDGDGISYLWEIAGSQLSGSSVSMTFPSGGNRVATLTVSDGKGGTVTDARTVVVGSATGTWSGSGVDLGNFTMVLAQNGPVVTGTYNDDQFGQGRIDPAQPGFINAAGHIEMRMKQAAFTDFTFRGDMEQSGQRIAGQLFGSGFNGEPFSMTKQ